MSILIERASSDERAQFFHKNRWVIARLLGDSPAEKAEEKPKRKRKTATKAKAKAKPKAKAKAKPKAKPKETPAVEKKAPEVAEPVVEVAVETPAEPTPVVAATPDDLTKINGLGPKMVESLTVAGITTFDQLAGLTKKRIAKLGESIKGFASTYERKEFKKQAKELGS